MSRRQLPLNSSLQSYLAFPAILGNQVGRPQYATIWTVGMLMRIADEPLARILLNEPTDARFIRDVSADLSEAGEPAFSQAFMLGVHGQIEFIPTKECASLGNVRMDPNSRIEILDGVHRLAALQDASMSIQQTNDLTVPVLLTPVFSDTELARLRAELSCRRPAIRSNAQERQIQENQLLDIARTSIVLSAFLTRAVDPKSTAIASRSKRLFAVRTYARACRPLLEHAEDLMPEEAAQRLADFWENLAALIAPWRRFRDSEIDAYEIRCTSILGWSSTLAGLALLGARLMRETPSDWRRLLEPFATLDWRKDAEMWNAVSDAEGRPFKGNQAAERIYRLLRTACGSERESGKGIQPVPSATSLVSLRNRGTSA